MNKKELIEAVIELPVDCSGSRPKIDKLTTLELIKLLDEPEKVVIPKFVADYIEFQKKNNFHVYGAMRVIEDHYDKNVPEWFYEKNIETFVRAWLDGYEVEKEKLFKVRLKGTDQYLCNDGTGLHFQHGFKTDFTKDYLEKRNFCWVFDCEGIEIEEVEE